MSALTAETVQKIAGQMDEGRVLEIIKTGATEAELVEALEWLHGDDAMARDRHHEPDSRVALVRDILSRSDIATEEEDR